MGVHLPALGATALVSLWICTCLNVNPIRLQNVLGHGLQSSRTVHFERCAPAGGPSGQDEIRITSRVIGVEVRHKSYLQVGGLKCRDVPVENRRLGATDDARSEIDKIGAIVNNNGGRRTGTVRIGHGRARAEENHLRPGRAYLRRLTRRLLGCGCYRHQHQSREAHNPGEFHGILDCRKSYHWSGASESAREKLKCKCREETEEK